MAKQEVEIKEVEVIKVYNHKFGDFHESFIGHIHQLQKVLQEKAEKMQQARQAIKKEWDNINDEIAEARRKNQEAHNHGTYETHYNPDGSSYKNFVPDYNYISQCRKEFEHLSGPVYHNAQVCDGMAHDRLMKANEIVYTINQRTSRLIQSFQTYVGNGRQYLEKVAIYIDQYKETHLNT